MLDRSFLRAFFEQLDNMPAADIDQKIAEVENVKSVCSRGSEAYQDARFMLKHLARARIEHVFK